MTDLLNETMLKTVLIVKKQLSTFVHDKKEHPYTPKSLSTSTNTTKVFHMASYLKRSNDYNDYDYLLKMLLIGDSGVGMI